MSISFSGLATGLDTSSWVESLVKIKKEKVSAYEADKKTLEATQEALASIKTFFNSFRSMLEKVTDTKFGNTAMDIFSQKLATSTNASIISALASYEAEEASYDVKVDKLATKTKANSGVNTLVTETITQTATLATKLGDLGVKTGSIDITNGNNALANNICISVDDSISDFITKLNNAGVKSDFNEKNGIFSIDINKGSIVDHGTGILDKLGLKADGYESSQLVTKTTSTVMAAATGNTKLSEIGEINAGNIEVVANDVTTTIAIDKTTTFDDFIRKLTNVGVNAELSADGTFTIQNATLNDIGNTRILEALGLTQEVNSNVQVTDGLKYSTITTTAMSATGSTNLAELDGWDAIKDSAKLVAVTSEGVATTINVDGTTTIDNIVTELNNAGVNAVFSDGVLSVTGGVVAGNVADLLDLKTQNVSTFVGPTILVKNTIDATGTTKLKDLGVGTTTLSDGTVKLNKLVINDGNDSEELYLDENATIDDLKNELYSAYDITLTINNGVVSIDNGGTYITGDIADKLGLTLVSKDYYSKVTSTHAPIKANVSKVATLDSTLGDLGLVGKRIAIDNHLGSPKVLQITLSQSSMTLGSFFEGLKGNGYIDSYSMTDGVLDITFNNNVLFGDLAEALGIQRVDNPTTVFSTVTSTATLNSTQEVVATKQSLISDFVDFSKFTKPAQKTIILDDNGTLIGRYTVQTDTTFGDLIKFLTDNGVDATLSNGVISLSTTNPDDTKYIRPGTSRMDSVLSELGIKYTLQTTTVTTTAGIDYTGSVTTLSSNTKLTDLGCNVGRAAFVLNTSKLEVQFTITNSSTVNDFVSFLNDKGVEAALVGGRIVISGSGNYIKRTLNNNSYLETNALLRGLGLGEANDTAGYDTYYTVTTNDVVQCYNSNSNKISKQTVKNINSSTTFADLGMSGDAMIVFQSPRNAPGVYSTAYIHSTDSIGIYFPVINKDGTVSVNNIVSMSDNLKKALKLPGVGEGYTYTLKHNYSNSMSGVVLNTVTSNADKNTKIKDLVGYEHGNGTIKMVDQNTGEETYITVDQEMTLGEFIDDVFPKGPTNNPRPNIPLSTGNVNAGGSSSENLTIDSNGNLSITSTIRSGKMAFFASSEAGGSNLADLIVGNIQKESSTTYYNEFVEYKDASGSSKLGDLKDMAWSYTQSSLTSSTSPGTSTSGGSLGSTIGGGIGGIGSGPSMARPTSIDQYNISLSVIDKNGDEKISSISLTADMTLDDVVAQMQANGIDARIENGKIVSNTEFYVKGLSMYEKDGSIPMYLSVNLNGADPREVLFGAQKINIQKDYAGTVNSSKTNTVEVNATNDTLLKDLGVTSGEYYVYKDGVKYTALISEGDTINSFVENLRSLGLQVGLTNTDGGTKLSILGSGNSYIAKSNNTANASNIVEKLFTTETKTSYNYTGTEKALTTTTISHTATKDTMLTELDKCRDNAEGAIIAEVRGEKKTISVTSTETLGSLVDKFNDAGIAASFHDGKLYFSKAGIKDTLEITTSRLSWNLNNAMGIQETNNMSGFTASENGLIENKVKTKEKIYSASNYADMSTQLSNIGISDGTLSIFRNGKKALVTVDSSKTFGDFKNQLKEAFSEKDIDLTFENGKLKIYSTTDDVNLQVGVSTDKSNIRDVLGLAADETGKSIQSSRELFKVNTNTLVTEADMFRAGTITTGTFKVGNQEITVKADSKLSDIIAQINNNEAANATAYWDSINGKLVIQSRSSGAALINIETGTSNFTDILGFTSSTLNPDNTVKETRLNIKNQEIGSNAKFSINGTNYSSSSNTVDSAVSRIKGVTLNLKDISPNETVTINIQKNSDGLATAMEDIVNSYNELMKNVDEQLASSGKLHDQSTLMLIRNQLRNIMTSSDAGASVFRNLAAVGISVSNASGNNVSTSNDSIINLSLDKDKFLEAYKKDSTALKELLVGGKNNKGVFTKAEELLENSLKSVSGYFDSTQTSIKTDIRKTQMKITNANATIDRYRSRLEKKFSSMNMFIAQVQQQYSSFLNT